jgi:hypothetical protein
MGFWLFFGRTPKVAALSPPEKDLSEAEMTPDNLNTATLGVRPKKGQNPITSNLSQLNIMTCYTCPPLTSRTVKISKHYQQAVFGSPNRSRVTE